MRKGTMNTEIYYDDENDDEFVGVGLGADFCSEHEWGIDKIKITFGIDATKIGVDKRATTRSEIYTGEFTQDKQKYYFLTSYMPSWYENKVKDWKAIIKRYFEYINPDNEIHTCWDEKDFAFAVKDKKIITKMAEAFENNNILIFVGGQGVFNNGSLNLIIKDKFPEDQCEEMKRIDISYNKLLKAAEKTKIKKKLQKAGKTFYALSPRWVDDTETEIKFWLNPMEQKDNNSMWCNLQDLKDWIKEKGPIPIRKEKDKEDKKEEE